MENESTEVLSRKQSTICDMNIRQAKIYHHTWGALRSEIIKKKVVFLYLKLTDIYYHLKVYFPKVDQHREGKWFIHGTKRRKDNQLQSLELPGRIS